MWLVYPVTRDDTRATRRGVVALLAGSAVWYAALAAVLAVWSDPVLAKVRIKFFYQDLPKNWTPFLVLLGAFVLSSLLRVVGYRLCRNVGWAVGAGEGLTLSQLGTVLYLAACGTVYIGFSGEIAIVAAFGSAVELKFLKFPAQLFGMVVSQRAVRWVSRLFYARLLWLGLVFVAGMVLLAAHILTDLPRPDGSPTDVMVHRTNGTLQVVFNVIAGACAAALPALVLGYWLTLLGIYKSVERLLDPNGPVVPPEPPVKAGFDQLKHVLHNPLP